MFMVTRICIIRHGQTEANKNGLIQGRVDNPLNDTGRSQALAAAKILKDKYLNWDVVYCSPLSRAKETANIIVNELGLNTDILTDDNLIERDFGIADGKKILSPFFDNILIDNVEGQETNEKLETRAHEAILKIASNNIGKNILIVAHAHFIKGLILSIPTRDKSFSYRSTLTNASLNLFNVIDNEISIEGINIV